MLASVFNIKKIQQSKNIQSTKTIPTNAISQKATKQILQNSCIDSDGGISYWVKWTITTVISWFTRVEEDSCNSDGSLREWFCGNPWEAAWLLRSENYVTCGNGDFCQQWMCTNCNTPENILACSLWLPSCPASCITTPLMGDAIIENMYMLPDDTPMMLSTTYDNQIYLVIKNIWDWTLNVPVNTTYNSNRFSLKCNGPWWLDYFVTAPIQSQILPNESITTQIDVWPYSNDFHWRYTTPGANSISCILMSHPNPINTPPDPNNPADLYESDRTNNSYILNYTVEEILLPDVIIEDAYMLPSDTPQQRSNNSINQVFLTIKNIWNGDLIVPQLWWAAKFGLWFWTDKWYGWWAMHLTTNTTILHPDESTTIQLARTGQQDTASLYTDTWAHRMAFSVASQQEQEWMSPDINDTGMIFESNGNNNIFTLDYTVLSSQNLVWDITIEDMHIQNNPATFWNNTVNNKVYITLKNIWNGDITIPYGNGVNKFSLSCSSNMWFFWISTIWVGQTILWPNQSISTELIGNSYDTAWYGTVGSSVVTCEVESQQQQWWNVTNPNDFWTIFESNGTNNWFTVNYQVVYSK